MYLERQIGCYNVTINDGHLYHETNTWYYIMAIDKFDIGDKWEESKHYYIKGHEDGNFSQESFIHHELQLWMKNLTAREVSEIFIMYPNNYKFKIAEPQLVRLVSA
jgi:hypothetical protein